MHGIWWELLDDTFVEAYESGIVVLCGDGVVRRMYPRIFTCGADYPEKWANIWAHFIFITHNCTCRCLIAGIKHNGKHPCPRCLILKEKIGMIGSKLDVKRRISKNFQRTYGLETQTLLDIARGLIYTKRTSVQAVHVRRLLDDCSLAPFIVSLEQHLASVIDLLYSRMRLDSDFVHSVSILMQCSS